MCRLKPRAPPRKVGEGVPEGKHAGFRRARRAERAAQSFAAFGKGLSGAQG